MCFAKRFSLLLVLIFGTIQSILAAEPMDQATEKFRNDMITARKAYDQAVENATATYIKALKTTLAEQTQRGDLDAAVVTRDTIKWLESQQAAGNIIMDKLAGTSWMNTIKVTWEWKKDGSFYRNGKPMSCVPVDARRVAVVFGNSNIQMFVFDENFQTFAQWGKDDKDTPFTTSTRIKLGK
jgi:hypothetical protein